MFEGQYFTEWVREYNVEKPFKIPDTWLRFMWMDYGYRAPSAVYWAALDEYGRLHVYRELYETGLTYRKLAKKIYAMTPPEEREALSLNQVADPAIFSKKGEDDTEKSGAEQMYEETNGWLNWRRGNNNRIIGWGVMRDYMRAFSFEDDGKKIATSKLIFFEGVCKAAIRTIPALVHDSCLLYTSLQYGTGYNVITRKREDFYASGIIDPVKVVKSALKNAVAMGTSIMTSGASIVTKRPKQ